MREKEFQTIKEYLCWCYSNMAMAHVALKNSHKRYETLDYMVRAKLYKGLCSGAMSISTLYDDEKYKLNNVNCCYCGCTEELTLDHLIPRASGGQDTGDNIVYACRSCNSSKNKEDLIIWFEKKNKLPPILVLRRYLKLAFGYFEEIDILELPFCDLNKYAQVFKIGLLPTRFPQPENLRL
ncbi:MAG: HNH endonuclease [Bacteroidales bacterium]|nr:HNH endonuclease [Bacteroidales bacterium]